MVAVLGWLGALLGSFVGAQVWRLRARQLIEDKNDGEPYDKQQLAQIKGLSRSPKTDRSECLHCHHQLAWYDLIPVISWLTLGGRCRYCRKRIGYMEPLLEVGLAAVFIVSYLAWPTQLATSYELAQFVVWLIACVLMAILFVYDARWSLLPYAINVGLIGVGIGYVALSWAISGVTFDAGLSLLLGIGIMSGLYLVFSLFGYVGLGDAILGLGLSLLLGKWELAFLALFLANLFGCFMLIPLAVRGKLRRNLHIPFGPFMILGTIIALLWGQAIIAWVFTLSDTLLNTLMV